MPAVKPDGKRTIKKSLNITPETNALLKELRSEHKITLADLVTWAVKAFPPEPPHGGAGRGAK